MCEEEEEVEEEGEVQRNAGLGRVERDVGRKKRGLCLVCMWSL